LIQVEPARAVVGHIAVPGDKSISHRAVLIGAIAEGETTVAGFGRSADTEATLAAVRTLGVEVAEDDVDLVRVEGRGLRGLREPEAPIDCGNSGTLLRLLPGILAGQEGGGRFELTGDESLRARPVDRVAEPLMRMGAAVETAEGLPPLVVSGGHELRGIRYELPVPSAQVKSCVLLAGLYAAGETTVVEPIVTRDHTEILLAAAGARLRRRAHRATVGRAERLSLGRVDVPGDFSSSAPFIVAATLLSGSELYVHDVGLNPTRTGLLDVLARMGARITVFNRRRAGGEQVGDLEVREAELVGTAIEPDEVPGLVDELPLFALAAACARGESVVRGAGELRLKETDRIESVTSSLKALGVRISERDDGFGVRGVPTRPKGGGMDARGDHRMAIMGAIAGLVSREGVRLQGEESAAVSFPGFFDLLESVTQR
jgi:3-phosphoshikimate 1-carboxyvinyltransferase